MLEDVVGKLASRSRQRPEEPARSPGQMAKHYSPRTPLRLVEHDALTDDFLEARRSGLRFTCVTFYRTDVEGEEDYTNGSFVNLPANPERAATLLYDTLFRLDQRGLHFVMVELPPDTPAWAAVRDRLTRAASSG
jgi:L-threonylcarbamoyladenylate synthase